MTLAKITVGVDLSPDSQRAVDHAVMLARLSGAALTLVHVAQAPPPYLEADRAKLGELRERLVGQGVEIANVLADGEPDTALAEVARTLGSDLIVVGTHGRTGLRRIALGSVAEKTVRLASSSVLVARGDAPAGGYRHVVVGTDFSEQAWTALARALELTAKGGHVHVVHAWHPPYSEIDPTGALIVSLRKAAEETTEANRERVLAMPRPEGVTVGLDLAIGVPFAILDEYSADAQLIVVGSHGRRGLRRLLLGSVAEATVRHARCSVLVAR